MHTDLASGLHALPQAEVEQTEREQRAQHERPAHVT